MLQSRVASGHAYAAHLPPRAARGVREVERHHRPYLGDRQPLAHRHRGRLRLRARLERGVHAPEARLLRRARAERLVRRLQARRGRQRPADAGHGLQEQDALRRDQQDARREGDRGAEDHADVRRSPHLRRRDAAPAVVPARADQEDADGHRVARQRSVRSARRLRSCPRRYVRSAARRRRRVPDRRIRIGGRREDHGEPGRDDRLRQLAEPAARRSDQQPQLAARRTAAGLGEQAHRRQERNGRHVPGRRVGRLPGRPVDPRRRARRIVARSRRGAAARGGRRALFRARRAPRSCDAAARRAPRPRDAVRPRLDGRLQPEIDADLLRDAHRRRHAAGHAEPRRAQALPRRREVHRRAAAGLAHGLRACVLARRRPRERVRLRGAAAQQGHGLDVGAINLDHASFYDARLSKPPAPVASSGGADAGAPPPRPPPTHAPPPPPPPAITHAPPPPPPPSPSGSAEIEL